MPRKRKTEAELKAANAVRQARWRLKHKWLAKERKLATYGKSGADKKAGLAGPVTEAEEKRWREVQETHYADMALVEGDPEVVREHAGGVARRTGAVERAGGRAGGVMEVEAGIGRGAGGGEPQDAGSGGGSWESYAPGTEAGRAVVERLKELKARREEAGVEVELKF